MFPESLIETGMVQDGITYFLAPFELPITKNIGNFPAERIGIGCKINCL